MKRRALLGLLVLAPLSGCGWRLRGQGDSAALPFKAIALEDRGVDVDIYRALEARLRSAGVRVISTADLRLVLAPSRWHISRTQVTLTGDAAAELLSLKQPFELWRGDQRLLADVAEVYRDHQIDTAALAAAEAERRSLQAQMRQAVAEQILRQLRYVK